MIPLSALQRAFWLGELLDDDRGARAALTFGVDVEGTVDVERLDRALVEVVKRHPLLRARFAVGDDGPGLTIEAAPSTILAHVPGGVRAALAAWCARPVSVRAQPLVKAAVAIDGDATCVRVVAHHAVFDGQSKDVFLRDLAHAYRHPGERAPDPGSGRDAPFWRAHVARELSCATGDAPARWRASRATSANAPCDSVQFGVDPELTALVGAAARQLEVSKFTVHLTAWHAALARLRLDDEDVVTPVALSTRAPADAWQIGPFVNQLPVRSTTPCVRSFRTVALELAAAVRRLTSERHRRAHDEAADGTPRMTVSYRRDALGELAWPDAKATPVVLLPLHVAPSDVVVRMVHHGPTASGSIDVDGAVLPRGYASRLAGCWRALLRAGCERLDARVGELPLLEP